MDASNRTEPRECATHGTYEARVTEIMGRVIASRCPTCAAEDAARQAAREKREAEEAKTRRIELLLKRSGIPLRFQARSFENYEAEGDGQQRALRVARTYAENWPQMSERGTCLIFSGAAGTGKTHLACAIANEVISKFGSSAVFTTVSDALRAIRRAYDRDSGVSEAQAIIELVEPSLLILDEVGMDYGTDHSKTLLFDVLNKRYENIRPTIILTNLDAPALRDYFGDRIVDRLREGGGKLVAFTWNSHRA